MSSYRARHGIDHVIHCAGFAAGGGSNHRIDIAVYRRSGLLDFIKLTVEALAQLRVLVARQVYVNVTFRRGLEEIYPVLLIRNGQNVEPGILLTGRAKIWNIQDILPGNLVSEFAKPV